MAKRDAAPPGPTGLFASFQLVPKLRANLLGYFEDLAKQYGDVVSYSLAGMRILQLNHPDPAIEVLSTKNAAFQKPANLKKVLGQWNGNGLVVNEGPSWVRQRRLVNPAFKPQEVARHAEAIVRRTDRMIDGWTSGQEVDVSQDLARLTLGVVAEALFGAEVDHLTDAFIARVADLNEVGTRELSSPFVLPMWAPTPGKAKIRRATAFLRSTVDEIIAQRKSSKVERHDLLAALLSVKDEEGDGASMSDTQARDEAVNLLLGGNETTATGLVWTAHLLSEYPQIQDEARDEVQVVLGERAPGPSDVPSLRLAERSFKEAMRLYPPAYVVPREAKEDVEIGGFALAKGTLVQIVPYLIQRDARWFDEPLAFRPRRFEREDSFHRGAYLPFGAGPRACIGRGFALMEGALVTARLLQRVRLVRPPSAPPVEMEAQVSLHPKGGLRLRVEKLGSG
jgi:cytochrome P450